MQLSYRAANTKGEIVKGIIEARSASEAAKFLRTKDLVPTIIVPFKQQDLLSFIPFVKKSSR